MGRFSTGRIETDYDKEYHSTLVGDGLYRTYLQNNGRCFNVHRDGNGLHLTLRPMLAGVSGNGIYTPVGSRVYDGKDVLLEPQRPF